MTGMPLRKIAFMSSELALAEPVPLTVAILSTKSLVRLGAGLVMGDPGGVGRCASGDLRLTRGAGAGLVLGVRPAHVRLLHVPGGRRAALGAQPAVHAQ